MQSKRLRGGEENKSGEEEVGGMQMGFLEQVEQRGGGNDVQPSPEMGLVLDLTPELLCMPPSLDVDAYGDPSSARPPPSPNPVPFSWAEQMDNEDLYAT